VCIATVVTMMQYWSVEAVYSRYVETVMTPSRECAVHDLNVFAKP
jgi:hypothetical protein